MINVVPPWVYWLAIAGLSTAVGVQQVRVANGQTALAEQVAARSTETAERTQLALDYTLSVANLQSKHAADQLQKDDDYAKQIKLLTHTGDVERATAQRLRDKIATFTSGGSQSGETDASAGQRARDRLPVVGALLAESVELEAESRAIIQRRDAEVARLLEQITIDRAACSAN